MDILKHPYFSGSRTWVNLSAVFAGLVSGVFTPSEFVMLLQRKFKYPETQDKLLKLQWRGIEKYADKDGSVELFGHRLYTVTGDLKESMYLIDQIVRCNQYRTELIKDGDVVIDGGANKGIFSVKVAHEHPNAKVYAFEPVRETFLCLQKNIAPYPNVSAFEMGLGDATVTRPMRIDPMSPDANSMADSPIDLHENFGKEIRDVAIASIDDFVAQHAIPHVDFIKMDTEGYEGKILQGAAKTIQRYKPMIVMSAYHNKSDIEGLPKLLNSIMPGYEITLEKRNEPDFICVYFGKA